MFEQLPSVLERSRGDGTSEALLVIDVASGGLSYVNAAATELFDLNDSQLAHTLAVELIPEFDNLTPRSFEASLTRDGAPRPVSVRLERMRGGPYARYSAMLASIVDLDDPYVAQPLPAVIVAGGGPPLRLERLESLWSLVVRKGFAGAEQVKALLREGAAGMALERATLARVDGDELVVEFAWPEDGTGARVPVERSLSRAALTRSGTFAVLDTRSDAEFRRVTSDARCFLASAFRVGDVRWVLTFSSSAARQESFDDEDWRYVEYLVEALSRGIERDKRDERIERLAYSDALTSLPNRMAVLGKLDEAISEAERVGERVAVLFVDIDGFKNVNDTVGHRGGDVVLAEVAQRLRGTLREQECIGRLGGDEFAIVMPHISDRDAIEAIAQRIEGVLTFPFVIDEYRFALSASIGVAVYPDDAKAREDLLACADAAMYSAKEEGGSRVRFGEPAYASEVERENHLLCYQPILNLQTGRIVSVEALVRRVHPVHGMLAPERGWSIARDEAGRRSLDRWVLREALTQARAWQLAGTPMRIDVNLAAFDRRDIDELLADDSLSRDVGRLRIEIAPEQFRGAEPQEAIAEFVEHCGESGLGFVVDGFDGSLGALAALSKLPIDAVKLDRTFVESVLTSRTARAIVEGTILVAKSLGWSVIAKGVETLAQHDALVALECDEIQGFYVAHPMTAPEFETWLSEREFLGREA
jgi:diguanylate cyclase (GGDEF)-like protein